jgi:hypothetical protein
MNKQEMGFVLELEQSLASLIRIVEHPDERDNRKRVEDDLATARHLLQQARLVTYAYQLEQHVLRASPEPVQPASMQEAMLRHLLDCLTPASEINL